MASSLAAAPAPLPAFQQEYKHWQALRAHFAVSPPEPSDRFLIGTDIPPRVAAAIADAHGAGIMAGRSLGKVQLPIIEGDDGTAAMALRMIATSGYIYASKNLTKEAVAASSSVSTKAPKVANPEFYKGGQHEFQTFQGQLQLMFQADPARFQTDQSRIVFAASFLRGPARDWWAPNIDPRTGAMKFQTYSEFLEALSNAFDDPDSQATAARDLRRLRQKDSSCADYYAKFVTIAAKLNWNDAAKLEQFQFGLNNDIKRALISRDDPSDSLEAYAHVCISIDNKQRAFDASLRSSGRREHENRQPRQAQQQQQQQYSSGGNQQA